MKSTRILAMLSMGAALLVCQNRLARACSCLPPPSIQDAFDSATAVFLGEVQSQSIRSLGQFGYRVINFRVIESWKGVTGEYVGIVTPDNQALCGISPLDGQLLLIYTNSSGSSFGISDDELTVSLCSRGSIEKTSSADIEQFEILGIDTLELISGPDPLYPPYFCTNDISNNDSDDDGDGVRNCNDLCPNSGSSDSVDAFDCSPAVPNTPSDDFLSAGNISGICGVGGISTILLSIIGLLGLRGSCRYRQIRDTSPH